MNSKKTMKCGWRLALGVVAILLLCFCLSSALRGREGITMGHCYAKCDKLPLSARPDCIAGCCGVHCKDSKRTTQGCKHYCGVESRQRNTPRRILPQVSTHPDANAPIGAAEHLASHHPSPPLASKEESEWPKVYNAKTNKPLGNKPLPPNSRLIVPSVAQLLKGKWGK